MTSRRDFFTRGGLVLSLGALSAGRAISFRRPAFAAEGSAASVEHAGSIIAIADWTFAAASGEFAQETVRHGVDARGFDGDVGGLWLHVLEPEMATGGVAVVGLTGPGVLFCLETLARAHGFGAVFRAERPAGGAQGWPRVAARHALAAAAAASPRGGTMLTPFEHHVCSNGADHVRSSGADHVRPSAAEPRLIAWTLARNARRPAPQTT